MNTGQSLQCPEYVALQTIDNSLDILITPNIFSVSWLRK